MWGERCRIGIETGGVKRETEKKKKKRGAVIVHGYGFCARIWDGKVSIGELISFDSPVLLDRVCVISPFPHGRE